MRAVGKRYQKLLCRSNLEIGPFFVEPDHAHIVIDRLQSGVAFEDGTHIDINGLRPRHFICSEELYNVAKSAVAGIPRKEQVKIKREVLLDMRVVIN